MRTSTIIIIIVIIIIVLGIWAYLANTPRSTYLPTTTPTTDQGQGTTGDQTGQNQKQLFSQSPLSKNAYLISTANYDAKTKNALSGYTVTKKTLSDGSMQVTVSSTNKGFATQTYTVKPGEKLYFVEGVSSDDTNTKTDTNTSDDSIVLVDTNGYIVNK